MSMMTFVGLCVFCGALVVFALVALCIKIHSQAYLRGRIDGMDWVIRCMDEDNAQ